MIEKIQISLTPTANLSPITIEEKFRLNWNDILYCLCDKKITLGFQYQVFFTIKFAAKRTILVSDLHLRLLQGTKSDKIIQSYGKIQHLRRCCLDSRFHCHTASGLECSDRFCSGIRCWSKSCCLWREITKHTIFKQSPNKRAVNNYSFLNHLDWQKGTIRQTSCCS